MKSSINNRIQKIARTVLVLAFWVFIWHIVAVAVNKPVLISTPFDTIKNLIKIGGEKEFYLIIFSSVLRILTGFFAAVAIGTLLGILTGKIRLLDEIISPLLSVIKATPVASFIILALFWLAKESIPSFIAFLMVLPIIHGNVSEGIKNTPTELIEMTKIYNVKPLDRLKKLYLPNILPYFVAGFKTSLGLAWKAGVAAEVIALTKNSIGKELYEAKLYLETVDLFTWTLTVIVISMVLEKLLMMMVNNFTKKRKRGKAQ
ncbi:MAG: ABC transporter permease subunit [Clostridia bacterium]|nr:ABC transporter permease subunit [Clostridia bacterium]